MFRALSLLLKLAPLVCLFAAQPSMAAVAVASLDWSHLTVSVFAIPDQPPPTLTFFAQETQSTANSSTFMDSSDTHMHTSFNWTASSLITSDTPGAHGKVQASAGTLSASASSSSVVGTPQFFPTISSSATGNRTANFQLDAPAAVSFSVPYSLSVAGPSFSFVEGSDARVNGTAQFTTANGGFADGQQNFDLSSTFLGSGTQNGFLIFGIVASGPGSGSVTFGVSASASADFAPVPERWRSFSCWQGW